MSCKIGHYGDILFYLSQVLTPMYTWLILAFGEPLKTIDLSAMLLPKNVAGGGKQCRLRHCFLYQKDWK
jgi:hypothetical protein